MQSHFVLLLTVNLFCYGDGKGHTVYAQQKPRFVGRVFRAVLINWEEAFTAGTVYSSRLVNKWRSAFRFNKTMQFILKKKVHCFSIHSFSSVRLSWNNNTSRYLHHTKFLAWKASQQTLLLFFVTNKTLWIKIKTRFIISKVRRGIVWIPFLWSLFLFCV